MTDDEVIVAAYNAAAVPELDIRGDVEKARGEEGLGEGFEVLEKQRKSLWKSPIRLSDTDI